jgi:hypothetical protein
MLRQHRLNDPSLDPDSLAVDNTKLSDTSLEAGLDILEDNILCILRVKQMQIERTIDRILNRGVIIFAHDRGTVVRDCFS